MKRETMLEKNIDSFTFIDKEKRESLLNGSLEKYFNSYIKKHNYFSLNSISHDFIREILDLNPKQYKIKGFDILKRALRRKFSIIINKNEKIGKQSKFMYKILSKDEIISKYEKISKKELLDIVRRDLWDLKSNKVYEEKTYKVDGEKFILSDLKWKLLSIFLIKKEVNNEKLKDILTITSINYHLQKLIKIKLITKDYISNGYRKGSKGYYKIKREYI